MSQKNNPFKLNIGFLTNVSLGESRDYPFSFDSIHISPDLDLEQISGYLIFSKTSNGVLARVILTSSLETECVRCLKEFSLSLAIDFTELYAFSKKSTTETGLLFPEDGQIDLSPIIREYLLLERPISPLCSQDCKGLCPICGENLNESECHHEKDDIDPRLEILKNLFDQS